MMGYVILYVLSLFIVPLQTNEPTQYEEWFGVFDNGSTQRVYTAENAYIRQVYEIGEFAKRYDGGIATNTIITYGEIVESNIVLVPTHPTCWALDIETNDHISDQHFTSFDPCYRVFIPAIGT